MAVRTVGKYVLLPIQRHLYVLCQYLDPVQDYRRSIMGKDGENCLVNNSRVGSAQTSTAENSAPPVKPPEKGVNTFAVKFVLYLWTAFYGTIGLHYSYTRQLDWNSLVNRYVWQRLLVHADSCTQATLFEVVLIK